MKKLLFALIFVACTIFAQAESTLGEAGTVVSQQSMEILNKVSATYKSSTGTELKLKIGVVDNKSGMSNSATGVLKTAGNRFNLSTNFADMIFDGKTLNIYDKQTNELTISKPTQEEISSVDPTSIITIFKQGYKISDPEFDSTAKIATITLYPENRSDAASMIKVKINTQTSTPVEIRTYGKNGVDNFVEILKVDINKTFKDEIFYFNADKYSKLQIIDLR